MRKVYTSLIFIIAWFNLSAQSLTYVPKSEKENTIIRQNTRQVNQQVQTRDKPHGKALIGFMAGFSMATNFYDYGTLGGEPPAGFLPIPAAGFTFDFESKGSFSFLMGLYFKGKGDKINMADYVSEWKFPQEPGSAITAEAEGSIKTAIYWIEVPMAFTFNIGRPNRLQFGVGPYAAYALMGKEKSDYTINYFLDGAPLTTETVKEEKDLSLVNLMADSEAEEGVRQINRIDYGIYALLGYKFSPFEITFSTSIGFANLLPFKGDNLFSATKSEKFIKSFTPTLTLTYFLKK
jgi:hypothetical protein